MFKPSSVFQSLLAAVSILVAAVSQSKADIVIIGSDDPDVTSGEVLKDSGTLAVAAGRKVRIMVPSGQTRLIEGPAKTKVSELAQDGAAADVSLWNTVTARLDPSVTTEAKSTGATRSVAAPAALTTGLPHYKFSWRSIPVAAQGDVCVERGGSLELVRADVTNPENVTVADLQAGGRRADVHFAEGSQRSPWPREIEPRVGSFALQTAGTPARSIKLRLISPLPGPEDALRVLHGQRCEMQRNALLEAMRDPTFQISAVER